MNKKEMGRNSNIVVEGCGASVMKKGHSGEGLKAVGLYHASAIGPVEHLRKRYLQLKDELRALLLLEKDNIVIARVKAEMESMLETKFVDSYPNLVTDVGANDILDKYLAGSAYTAALYLGLISNSGYSAVANADTMASHAGWTETSGYDEANRPTAAWSAASSRSKALSSNLTFSINTTVTVKGSFLTTNSTKSGTTGILVSAGLFTGGDQALNNGDTLSVSYSLSLPSA